MKIQFLGTGAADWDISRPSRDINFRRYSSALIDDTLLIDPGPCVFEFADTFGLTHTLDSVKYVINTHSHSDHFDADTLSRLESNGAEFIAFSAGESRRVGKYEIEAFAANHATAEKPVHFMISDGEKRIFYGLDGAWLLYDEYRAFARLKPELAVLDATIGDIRGDYRIFEHNNLHMVEEMKQTLDGFCPRFMISHMARTLHGSHAQLCERMKPSGIEVAYDGLIVEL